MSDSTLEENIAEILNGLRGHDYGTAEETLTIATQAILSLYQKELEKELSELNSAYYALAGANRNRAFAELLSERITKLTGDKE